MMPHVQRVLIGTALAATLLAGPGAPTAHALPGALGAPPPPFREGTHAFRRMLHDLGLEPLRKVEDLADDPASKILIVLGRTEPLEEWQQVAGRDWLSRFVSQGGAVLLATDRRTVPLIDRTFGWGVDGGFLSAELGQGSAYRELPDCPLVTFAAETDPRLFSDLRQVATNRPSFLTYARGREPLQVFGGFGRVRRWDDDLPELRRPAFVVRTPVAWLFVAGGDLARGRLLLLADHSVFINDMLMRNDNDNLEFAYRSVDWLTARGRRNQVLFLDDGRVRTDFEVPLEEPDLPPLPSLDAFIPILNGALQGLEHEDVFNRAFTSLIAPYGPTRFLQGLTLLLTLGLIVYGFLRLGQVRQRFEPGAPLLATVLARSIPAAAVHEDRHQALLKSRNLWEAARSRARQGLAAALGPPGRESGDGPTAPAPPLVRAEGSWWQRWRLRRQVRGLWRLAYGTPVRVSPRRFRQVNACLAELRAAVATGVLRLERPEER